ncbi:hypothetical protein Tco_1171161 [Tanacetum coccineum]
MLFLPIGRTLRRGMFLIDEAKGASSYGARIFDIVDLLVPCGLWSIVGFEAKWKDGKKRESLASATSTGAPMAWINASAVYYISIETPLPTPVSWLGSYTMPVIAAMSGVWSCHCIHKKLKNGQGDVSFLSRRNLIVSAHSNGDHHLFLDNIRFSHPSGTCGDGYVYETKYPDSSSASTLTGNQKNSLSYHGEPSVPKKQSSTLTVRNTQGLSVSSHTYVGIDKPPARAHANERDLTTNYGNNVNGNIVGANRDTRHHRYRVTKSQLSLFQV